MRPSAIADAIRARAAAIGCDPVDLAAEVIAHYLACATLGYDRAGPLPATPDADADPPQP